MNILKVQSGISRFTAIASLARAVSVAPIGTDGVPRVFVGVEHQNGETSLVAKTIESSLDTRLVLTETAPLMVASCLTYLSQRLVDIGLTVVSSENLLRPKA